MPISTLSRAHFNTGAFSTRVDAMTANAQAAAYLPSLSVSVDNDVHPITAVAVASTSASVSSSSPSSLFPATNRYPSTTLYPGG